MGRFTAVWDLLRSAAATPVGLPIVVLAALAGGAAGYPAGHAVYEYSWKDHRFCDDCHVHDYATEAWERSVHAGVTTCHDCHQVPIHHYPVMAVKTLVAPPSAEDMPTPEIENVSCEKCHSEAGLEEKLTGPMSDAVRARVVKIDHSRLHRVHLDAEARSPSAERGGEGDQTPGHILCMDCHGEKTHGAHRFESTPETCVGCHVQSAVHGPRLQRIRCRECHVSGFLADTLERHPGATDPAGDPP